MIDLGYPLDSVGNVKTITDTSNSGQALTFTYDALDRLTRGVTSGGGSGAYDESYAYNAIGNLTSKGGVGYTYGDAAHKHAVTAAGGNSYTYDANGNMLTRPGQTLAWDAENRLASVTQGGTTTTFTYNGDGQRVKVAVGNVITAYVGNLYEVNPSSGVTTTYYYLGSQRVAMRTAAGVTYLAGDHLGSASLATDSAGQKVSDERYYPYGGTRSGSMPTDYQFTGQKLDGGTGLYYYGARYYDPVTGRFVSADTIVPKATNPQDLNRYAYVRDNPVKYTDPTGHMVGCGAGDDTCGEVSPPTGLSEDERRASLYNVGTVLKGTAGSDSLANFSALTHVAARLNRGNSSKEFMSDLVCVILGMCDRPAGDVWTYGIPGHQIVNGPAPFLRLDAFPGAGSWRNEFFDKSDNQMYHFWYYVAVSYFNGPPVANLGNLGHDPVTFNPLSAFGVGPAVVAIPLWGGVSIEDWRLGSVGSMLGSELSWGHTTPEQVASWLRSTLGVGEAGRRR